MTETYKNIGQSSAGFACRGKALRLSKEIQSQGALLSLDLLRILVSPPEPSLFQDLSQFVGSGFTIRQASDRLPAFQQKILTGHIGEEVLGKVFSISENLSSENYWAELVHLAVSLKMKGDTKRAGLLLSWINNNAKDPEAINRSFAELGALTGQGNAGLRSEYLIINLGSEVTSFRQILPMMGASVLGSFISLRVMGSLAKMRPSYLTRGWFGQGIAAFVGFVPEVIGFTGITRFISKDKHLSIPEELFKSFLSLGALKTSGYLGKTFSWFPGAQKAVGSTLSSRIIRQFPEMFIPHATTFMGLLLVSKLENLWGLSANSNDSNVLLDITASMIGLEVGGYLGRKILGNHLNIELPGRNKPHAGANQESSESLVWNLGELMAQQPSIGKPGLGEANNFDFTSKPMMAKMKGLGSLGKQYSPAAIISKTRSIPPSWVSSGRLKTLFNRVSDEMGFDLRWENLSTDKLSVSEVTLRVMEVIENKRLEAVKEFYESTAHIQFDPPLDRLNPAEKKAISILREEVAPLVDEIYSIQEDPKNIEYKNWIQKNGDYYSKLLFERHQRDIGAEQDQNPFFSLLPSFPSISPQNGMVKGDISSKELASLEDSYGPEHPALDPTTVLSKDSRGVLHWQAMAKAGPFAGRIQKLASTLRRIAKINEGGEVLPLSLRKQLNLWAKALESGGADDYQRAVQSTIDQGDGLIRLNIGPLIPFSGVNFKRAFLLQVGIRDLSWKETLTGNIAGFQKLENQIDVPNYQPRFLAVDQGFIDPVYQPVIAGHIKAFPKREISGNSLSGQEFRGVQGNVRLVHLEVVSEIAKSISLSLQKMTREDLSGWDSVSNITAFVSNHEMGHLLGPQRNHLITRGKSVSAAFGEYYDHFEEAKADLAAVLLPLTQDKNGEISPAESKNQFRAYVGYLLSHRYKGKGNFQRLKDHDYSRLFEVGTMFKEGVFRVVHDNAEPGNNRIIIDYEKLPFYAQKLWQMIISFQSNGSMQEARAFAEDAVAHIPDSADRLILRANNSIKPFFIVRRF